MTEFDSLSLALKDWFEKPFSDLPVALRERIAQEEILMPWDSLAAVQRRSAALQLDYETDPARAEERAATWNEVSVDWDYWKQVPKLTTQEFCILRLLNDPRDFEHEKSVTFGDAGKPLGELVGDDVRIIERTLGPDITRPIPEWIAWAKLQNWDMPSYFRDYEKNGGTFIVAQDLPGTHDPKLAGNRCEVFRAMEKLTADEVSMTFVGDKNESGMGNNMLEISARSKTRRVPLAELDLVDRRKGTLNAQGTILLGMAYGRSLKHSNAAAVKMTTLRKLFSKHLGIQDNPFEDYRQEIGWIPRFKIKDLRGAADERAKREGERHTRSFGNMEDQGEIKSQDNYQAYLPNEDDYPFGGEDDPQQNDETAAFIRSKNHQP